MAYSNPIGPGLQVGRIDEGVDFSGSGPLYALGDGVIKSISDSGWPGTNYILLSMDDGHDVYYAENLAPNVKPGQRVRAGQQIAYARGQYPFIEIGWATSTPGVALASSHYKEGEQTPEGKDFAALLETFGLKIPGAAASSNVGNVQTTGFNPFGIFSIPGEITGFFKDAKTFIDALLWIVNPASWLRIGSFAIGMILLAIALYAFMTVGSDDSPFKMPNVVPVPV
jgi:murein DD-endopeptidase MepM/ murein hydrolase activator NlpD